MATKFDQPREASQLTHVKDMPPLEVVTEGIPAQEHIDVAPPVPSEAAHGEPERRGRAFAWALAGVIGFVLVAAGVLALTQYSSTGTSDLHMGLTPQAWQEFRADERASTTPFRMGLTLPAWQEFRTGERASEPVYSGLLRGAALPYVPYLSIPTIPAIPDVSIPSIEAIPDVAMPAVAAMLIPTIEAIPEMSIPTIPDMSIPTIPATTPTTTPATTPTTTPTMSIPSISFPTFPEIPTISVPSIPPFPSIPDM